MNLRKYISLLLLFPGAIAAQYIQVDASYTTQQLVQNVLINNPCASASNVVVSGLNFGSGNSFGYFTANGSSFPFADGIILSTGNAESAPGPNASLLSQGPTSWPGDSDLEDALGVNNSINATIMEFDFIPLANKISFDYIFSSEQYLTNPSPNQCNYTDGFVFLLRQVNSQDQYENLAVIPNTSTPVKVNTVRGPGTTCPPANPQYFDAFNGVNHPTNFNGQTKVMTATANVIPGETYHIKLVVADQGNNLYDSAIFLGGGSFRVEKDLGADRLFATQNPLCDGETLVLDATDASATSYQWYRNGAVLPGETGPTYAAISAGTYKVDISLGAGGCLSTGEIILEYAAPVTALNATVVQCDADNDGSATFDLTLANATVTGNDPQLTVSYFPTLTDAHAGTNPIPNIGQYTVQAPATVIAAAANDYGCAAYSTVTLQVANNPVPTPAPVLVCDEDTNPDGQTSINLAQHVTPQLIAGLPAGIAVQYYASLADATALANPLPMVFSNSTPYEQVIYALLLNGPQCYGVIPVTIKVNAFSQNFVDEVVYICPNSSLTLSVPDVFADYNWSTGDTDHDAVISGPGVYSITVTDINGCSRSKIFDVLLSEPPVFLLADIQDFAGGNNTVLINFSGNGGYQFSLGGEFYQDSPIFENVAPGEYDLFINNVSGCGGIGPIPIVVLDYPKYFTPNGDGINDVWKIRGLENRSGAFVHIFDRYGKLIYSFTAAEDGWNGTFDSKNLPSTDYWFVVTLPDGRTVRSHFALKR